MNLEFIDITPDNYRWINQKALYAFDKSIRLGRRDTVVEYYK